MREKIYEVGDKVELLYDVSKELGFVTGSVVTIKDRHDVGGDVHEYLYELLIKPEDSFPFIEVTTANKIKEFKAA